jgi:ABC-type antimicrobial peptide transport system permease subunit
VEPVIYSAWENDAFGWLAFSLRAGRDIAPEVRQALRSVDAAVPIQEIRTAEAIAGEQLQRDKLLARLGAAFGLVSVGICAAGLYALLAWSVTRRTREIGIRTALGAGASHILWVVLRNSAVLTGAAIAAGVPLSVLAGRLIASQLYGVRPADPGLLLLAVLSLALAAGVASALPAWRALRVHPAEALRHE